MRKTPYQKVCDCCFENNGTQLNPLTTKNTVAAGNACEGCMGEEESSGCVLATAYMPIQDYKAGYCPDEALCQGTLFPELVRPYC